MLNVKRPKLLAIVCGGFFLMVAAVVFLRPNGRQEQPKRSSDAKVIWTSPVLDDIALPGTETIVENSIVTDVPLRDLSFRVTPVLAGYIRVFPNNSLSLQPHEVFVNIAVTIPWTVAAGVVTGTIQIITAKSGITPIPLPVTLSIEQPTASSIPPTISDPSPDRIHTDPSSKEAYASSEIDVIFQPGTDLSTIRSIVASVPGVFLGSDMRRLYFQIQVSAADGTMIDYIGRQLESYPQVILTKRHWLN